MQDNHITDPRARGFVAALRRFDQSSDPTALSELFAPDATPTTFVNVVEGTDEFALEWTSTGTLTDDRSITYRGVTVIDLDGEKIVRLRTYYDTAAFTLTPAGRT